MRNVRSRSCENLVVVISMVRHSPCEDYWKAKMTSMVKVLEEICSDMDLVDIWRIRNLDKRLFTWKQTKPLIQRRLDFWLISDICQDEVEQVKIMPSIKSDHSAITLLFKGIEEQRHGPSPGNLILT